MLSWESLYSIKVGGVAPHVSEISEALARRGHEVHVFTRRGDFESYDKINGVHYQRADVDSSGDVLSQMDRMSNALYDRFGAVQKLFGDFDVVHGHDWHAVLALSQLDINIAKQVNILVADMGFPGDRIVMYPTTAGLGYGIEYAYSIHERSRLAALSGDRMMMMPVVCGSAFSHCSPSMNSGACSFACSGISSSLCDHASDDSRYPETAPKETGPRNGALPVKLLGLATAPNDACQR